MKGLWRAWILAWCGLVVAFGAVLAGGALAATDGPVRGLLAAMGGAVAPMTPPLRFAVALMGAVTLGWGLTILTVVRAIFTRPDIGVWLWRPLAASLAAWFVVDSTLSVVTGFALNALSNLGLIVLLAIPLLGSGVLRAGAERQGIAERAT